MKPLRELFDSDAWVRPYFKRYRPQLIRALVLGLAMFLCAALLMFSAGYLITRTTEEQNGILVVMLPIVLVQIFGIGKPIARYLERLVSHDWVFRMTSSLRQRLYQVVEKRAMHLKRTHQTGDFLGLLAEDIGHIQNLYLRTLFPLVIAWLVYAAMVVALGFVSLPFALFVLFALGIAAFVLPLVSISINRTRIERQKTTRNHLYTQLADNVLGASDWIFAGRGNEYLSSIEHMQAEARRDQAALNRYSRINDLVAMALFGVVAAVTLVWAGNHFGMEGNVGGPANWIAAFTLGFFPLIEVFMPLPMEATQAYTHLDAVERLNGLGDAPDIPEDDGSNSTKISGIMGMLGLEGGLVEGFDDTALPGNGPNDTAARTAQNAPLAMDSSAIEIENISFSYNDSSRAVLQNIDLSIPPGSKVAILGRSGSGKTTLAQLVRGDLTPTTGTVKIDGTSAHELGDAICRYVGVVQQQAYLFNRTLRENLAIGNPQATDADIWAVLAAVGLEQMVRNLEAGLDTLVDEAGMRFSGGERHRIALARVLLADVPIVVLDEPTVGLDPATESALLETLFDALAGKTLLMITHHLQGASHFDRIVFIEDGHIEIDDTPAQLEAENERYRSLLAFDRGIGGAVSNGGSID